LNEPHESRAKPNFAIFFPLKDFSVPNLAQRLSPKLDRLAYYFFRFPFNSFSFDGFSADAPRQQTPLNAESIGTVRNVTDIIGPSAPYGVAVVESGVFGALEELTRGRTGFCLSQ
jgi:hypothetical protein